MDRLESANLSSFTVWEQVDNIMQFSLALVVVISVRNVCFVFAFIENYSYVQ